MDAVIGVTAAMAGLEPSTSRTAGAANARGCKHSGRPPQKKNSKDSMVVGATHSVLERIFANPLGHQDRYDICHCAGYVQCNRSQTSRLQIPVILVHFPADSKCAAALSMRLRFLLWPLATLDVSQGPRIEDWGSANNLVRCHVQTVGGASHRGSLKASPCTTQFGIPEHVSSHSVMFVSYAPFRHVASTSQKHVPFS